MMVAAAAVALVRASQRTLARTRYNPYLAVADAAGSDDDAAAVAALASTRTLEATDCSRNTAGSSRSRRIQSWLNFLISPTADHSSHCPHSGCRSSSYSGGPGDPDDGASVKNHASTRARTHSAAPLPYRRYRPVRTMIPPGPAFVHHR
uniref:Putative secreted protein n=1 Tax=Anopheles marajoara TaxID=58244 RepID=A0A2M4C6E5_9DIPT